MLKAAEEEDAGKCLQHPHHGHDDPHRTHPAGVHRHQLDPPCRNRG